MCLCVCLHIRIKVDVSNLQLAGVHLSALIPSASNDAVDLIAVSNLIFFRILELCANCI